MLSSLVPMQCELIELEKDKAFLKETADTLEKAIAKTLAASGRCILGLSGGETPLPVYAELAKRPLEWQNVWVFLVDERYVSPDHVESNQHAIKEALIDKVNIPPEQFLAPDTWKPLPDCAGEYEGKLRELLTKGPPDVCVLGMGEDGHVGSLFPPLPPEAFDAARLVITTKNDALPTPDRVTVTVPVLTMAMLPVFFLKGRAKKRVWEELMKASLSSREWPAHAVLATGRAKVIAEWPKE